jgi:regulator of RNase E activity RraA
VCRQEAGSALTVLCFEEAAKEVAIKNQGVATLCTALVDDEWEIRAAAAGALMAVTTTDEGKRQILTAGGVHKLMRMLELDEDHAVVVLNALKTLANAAVNPEARRLLRDDAKFLQTLDGLVSRGESPLIQKHAAIARAAVLWQP